MTRTLLFAALCSLGLAGCLDAPDETIATGDMSDDAVEQATGVATRVYSAPELAEREAAEQTSGCISGGADGVAVYYAETVPISRMPTVAYDYDDELAEEVGLPADPLELALDPAAIFDIDLGHEIDSSQDPSLTELQGVIPAGQFGVFYRQTVRLHRVADVLATFDSGDAMPIGRVVLVDWDYLGALATGDACPPPPPPSMQPGIGI